MNQKAWMELRSLFMERADSDAIITFKTLFGYDMTEEVTKFMLEYLKKHDNKQT